MEHSLELVSDNEVIFYSNGKWLHPLFELESFLAKHQYDPASLVLKDKIVGRAAALFQLYLGIKTVNAGMMSVRTRTHTINAQNDILNQQIENLNINIARIENMLKDDAADNRLAAANALLSIK